MSTHNICFHGEIRKILCGYPLLASLGGSVGCAVRLETRRLRGVVGWCEGAVYLTSLGRPTDIGLQLGKACYPCSG